MEKTPTFCLIGNREGEINGCRIIGFRHLQCTIQSDDTQMIF